MRASVPVLLLLSASPSAQEAVLGLLRTPAGEVPRQAEIVFVPDPWPDLPAVAGLRDGREPVHGRADARGQFRVETRAPGGLLATNPDGLGAFRQPVTPGVPERIVLRPMAEVTLEGGAPFHAWPAALGQDGKVHPLPPHSGAALRLPPGSYQLWMEAAGRPAIHRLDLLSGQRVRLPRPPPPRFLNLPEGFLRVGRAWPASRPDLSLPAADPGRLPLPAVGAPFSLVLHDGTDGRLHRLWIDPTEPAPRLWRPPPASERDRREITMTGEEADGSSAALETRLWLLRAKREGWTPVAWLRGPGPHLLPVDPDLHWLAWAPGLAPRGGVTTDLPAGEVLLQPGRQVSVEVLLPSGAPAAGAPVWCVPEASAAASLRTLADARGRARIGPLAEGSWTLRILDPRGLPVVQPVPADEAIQVRLRTGAVVTGIVFGPDGEPAAGVPVGLRDPSGTWPLPERTTLTDAQGTFAFPGLPEDRAFVLRATVVRGAVTLAAQLARVTARPDPFELRLRSEDPALPGRDR